MARATTIAWVESPLQALGVVEAHAAGHLGERTRMFPRAGVTGIDATWARLAELGLPSGLELEGARSAPRGSTSGRTWALGDPLSGKVQRKLLAGRDGPLVLVDDGRASLHTLHCLAAGRPLTRQRVEASMPRRVLGRATGDRLLELAEQDALTVFTVFDIPGEIRLPLAVAGVRFARHRFGWLRTQGAPGAQGARGGKLAPTAGRAKASGRGSASGRRVVLGSAMVADGLIDPDSYLGWVRDRAGGHASYRPHRRENERTLTAVAGLPGVTLEQDGLPVELAAVDLRDGDEVVSLPSSALTTLRDLVGLRGVVVHGDAVPDGWWTEAAGQEFRRSADAAVAGVHAT